MPLSPSFGCHSLRASKPPAHLGGEAVQLINPLHKSPCHDTWRGLWCLHREMWRTELVAPCHSACALLLPLQKQPGAFPFGIESCQKRMLPLFSVLMASSQTGITGTTDFCVVAAGGSQQEGIGRSWALTFPHFFCCLLPLFLQGKSKACGEGWSYQIAGKKSYT